jgi:hypothetical protein
MNTKLVVISHNTQHKEYRRAGLLFFQDSRPFEVTAEQFAILQNDPRIDMHEVKTAKNAVEK